MMTISAIQTKINEAIRLLKYPEKPAELYYPIVYILEDGGKRLRPTLLLLAYNLYSDDIEKALKPSIGLEVFHNFTLLHDDIMDKADTRRNRPTVHKKWNENVAILSGDAMMIHSFQYFYNLPDDVFKPALELFTKTALEVCEGQQFDMNFETQENVSIKDYMEMIRLKTAVLIAASLKLGGIIAHAPEKDLDLLYKAGISLGLAFQLQDDYLDVYGDTSVFGKNIGGDIEANKKTFLMLTAFEKANSQQLNQLKFYFNAEMSRQQKVESITSIYNQIGVPFITQQKVQELTNEALNLINQLTVKEKTSELKLLITSLIARNK
ncbi:MAG: polyprenyl synthetase family protein [Bacteroidales bacterium]|nr:polyprenyl synthetase family protein [Bacteroidales bacterium]